MKKDSEIELLKYAMYTMLYANDLACNCIKELKPFIEKKDKETKKIYGALLKRSNCYLKSIRELIHESANNFLADYNSMMDDINDECVENYRDSIIEAYYKGGIKEYEFLGYLETARSIFYLSITSLECIVEKLSKEKIKSYNLKNYSLKPYAYIMDNLVNWCYRFAEKEVSGDLDLSKDKEVMEWFCKINENILNYDVFLDCYEKASKMCNDNIEC